MSVAGPPEHYGIRVSIIGILVNLRPSLARASAWSGYTPVALGPSPVDLLSLAKLAQMVCDVAHLQVDPKLSFGAFASLGRIRRCLVRPPTLVVAPKVRHE